jgi:zinc D-Ala-D-Ala carboxypeptidase
MRAAAALLTLCVALPAWARGAPDAESHFRMSLAQLDKAVSALPASVREGIHAEPAKFLVLMRGCLLAPRGLLVLVDKRNALDKAYEPADLTPIDGTGLHASRGGYLVRSLILPDLLAMSETARKEGISILVSSAYRSYDYQVMIYEREMKTSTREEVEKTIAPPGHSQHQLGTALDFGSITPEFADTRAGKWMTRNAWRFGFSLAYPKGQESETGYSWEPWHFRYIGKPAAEMVHAFFSGRQELFLAFYGEVAESFREKLRAP